MNSFHICFQITRKIIFEVNYYLLGNNTNKYFTTEATEFNQPKTDYKRCGQAQKELLPKNSFAMEFFKKWDVLHLNDLTLNQYNEIIKDLDVLKNKYNFIISNSDRSFSFEIIKKLSKEKVKYKSM